MLNALWGAADALCKYKARRAAEMKENMTVATAGIAKNSGTDGIAVKPDAKGRGVTHEKRIDNMRAWMCQAG